uniref:Baseplate protein n=1 Tax=Siphoviridae sp. ctZpP9 TaxID=2826386 RepID=A0A8S5MW01_9CAUD|nr:MAG TPA: baseplate protein [Siphoviridae sp. ctZpP9]
MADDILKNIPLPADLPENWTSQQTVAPTGAEVGMDEQHGYNYLMKQVNNAQKALKVLAAQREEDRAKIKFWVSPDPTSPASLFGGTWERIKDTFILAAGDTYAAGISGGEAEHTLTESEIPAHEHQQNAYVVSSVFTEKTNIPDRGLSYPYENVNVYYSTGTVNGAGNFNGISTGSVGMGSPHNNMPPYVTVYVWKRIA